MLKFIAPRAASAPENPRVRPPGPGPLSQCPLQALGDLCQCVPHPVRRLQTPNLPGIPPLQSDALRGDNFVTEPTNQMILRWMSQTKLSRNIYFFRLGVIFSPNGEISHRWGRIFQTSKMCSHEYLHACLERRQHPGARTIAL